MKTHVGLNERLDVCAAGRQAGRLHRVECLLEGRDIPPVGA